MNASSLLRSLLDQNDWVAAICNCNDAGVKRNALFHCAMAVLPYWESKFTDDESMARLVNCMAAAAASPTTANDAQLAAAIPSRERRHWDLSPPPDFPEPNYSNCPADFAGDSIFYAACAFGNGSTHDDDRSSFDNAIECIARVLVERNGDYDDNTDYQLLAANHLRETLLNSIGENAR